MSDSEGSVASANGSEKSAIHDETAETMPSKENHNGDKPEEFEKLLQSMVVTHSVSEEEEQVEEEDNVNEKKIIGSEIPDLARRIPDHQFQCRARQKRGIPHSDDDNGGEEAMPLDDLFREDM
ncbi:hypothetical protein ALC57_01090 [Trachymyrmex cornetzi]|uniref:Uncharacterized protein n=1 Tax=Trachymyrmex cornetzi TaxID=471704 RepID=A0A151JQG7_9HYME|nr:hypothetical protein ALC57_01090 [Trachymyrmex cornetzi]